MSAPRRLALAALSGLVMAAALPQAIPWISLQELDPGGRLEWLAWIGLVPLLFALAAAPSKRGAFAVGLVSGIAYFYGAIWWVNHAMTAFGGVPFPVAFAGLTLLVLYGAVHWAGAFLVSWTIRKGLGWPMWTHLPAVWVGAELLRNYSFTGFPWANLGYLQARHLSVAQLASVTGVYGIAALIVLVNCTIQELLSAVSERRRPIPWRPALVAGLLVAVVAISGMIRIALLRGRIERAPKLSVALVQGNVDQDRKNQRAGQAKYILDRYLPLTVEADRRGVDLIAWPEATYPYLIPPDLKTFEGLRTPLPTLRRAHLLVGTMTYEEVSTEDGQKVMTGGNVHFLLRPDLKVIGSYAKHHLVPFGEYVPLHWLLGGVIRSVAPTMVMLKPGADLRVLSFELPARADAPPGQGSTPSGGLVKVAPMICFDAIFPEINRTFAAQDPDLLLNPTNDAWYGYSSGPYQFLAIVQMRAIEAGRPVARPAYAGISALIDATGEVQPGALPVGPVDHDLAPDPEEPARLLVGQVARLRGRTLYTILGDLFAGMASLYGVCVLMLAVRALRRERTEQGAIVPPCPPPPQNSSQS